MADISPAPPPRGAIPQPAPPSKPPRSRTGVIIAIAIVGFIAVVSIIDAVSGSDDGSSSGDEGMADTSDCLQPAGAWLDTLQSGFYKEYRSAAITSSAYVETETSEGTAYYVAVNVDGVAGTAVFGTSDPPLQSDPGSSLVRTQPRPSSRISGSISSRTFRRGPCFWTTPGHLQPSLVSE